VGKGSIQARGLPITEHSPSIGFAQEELTLVGKGSIQARGFTQYTVQAWGSTQGAHTHGEGLCPGKGLTVYSTVQVCGSHRGFTLAGKGSVQARGLTQ